CGLIYFFAMFFRLTFGVIFESAPQWFSYSIPAFFHLVLASFLLVIAHYHLPVTDKAKEDAIVS
ncbi:MAG: hypothetical protein AAF546_11360, partial [Verrucomicrobiota bacterium]